MADERRKDEEYVASFINTTTCTPNNQYVPLQPLATCQAQGHLRGSGLVWCGVVCPSWSDGELGIDEVLWDILLACLLRLSSLMVTAAGVLEIALLPFCVYIILHVFFTKQEYWLPT